VDRFKTQGVEIRKYPIEKDETDLELALDAALEIKPSTIWVAAALGDRLDQTLANIFLLTRPAFAEIDLRLVDGLRQVFLIRGTSILEGKPGDRVSLLPLSQEVTDLTTLGLYYPLENETLFRDQTRGISNHMTSSTAKITLQHGHLLCIHESLDPEERNGKDD
jgi:thiamine pyrophosphokinase